jgi:mono/diheme cytochrome c family protein
MVGCRAVVVALSTARELGLAAVGGAFILFAVLSAFVLPTRDRNFPGRRLPLFLAVTVLFFAAMITAVVVLAREPEEEGGHEAGPAETQAPPETQPPPTTETQAGTQTEPAVQRDPAAGKSVFASAGCGSCHTLEAAGSSGTIGPNLDDLAPDYDAIVEQVTNGGGGMPAFGGQLSEQQIQDVAAFVFDSTH